MVLASGELEQHSGVSLSDLCLPRLLRSDFVLLQESFKSTGFVFGNLVSAVLSGFSKQQRADEIVAFFERNKEPAVDMTVRYDSLLDLALIHSCRQCVESIRSKARRLASQREPLERWLKAKYTD